MSCVGKLLVQQKVLADELKLAMLEERGTVLKDIKDKIKRFEFNATDFKGLFKSRVTQKLVDEFIARKEAAKLKPVRKKRAAAKKIPPKKAA